MIGTYGRKGFILAHSSQYSPRSRQWELEAVGHIAPPNKNEGAANAKARLTLYQSRIPIQRMVPPMVKMAFPTSVDSIKITPHTHMTRGHHLPGDGSYCPTNKKQPSPSSVNIKCTPKPKALIGKEGVNYLPDFLLMACESIDLTAQVDRLNKEYCDFIGAFSLSKSLPWMT